jgi:flagellar hook-associated protein 2
MAMRLSGLASGMDTEAIVKGLMEAHSIGKTKVENKKTKLEWTQDKWKELNTKLYSLYTDKVSKLKMVGNYNSKKASISDTSIASVTAKNNAVNGNYTLEVNKIATSNYVTGGKLKLASGSGKVTAQTKISDLAGGSDLVGKEIEIAYDGKVKRLSITEDTKVSDYVNAFKEAGLTASFDEGQQRIFTSSAKSGAQSNFTLRVSSDSEIAIRNQIRSSVASDYDALSDADKKALDSYLIDIKNNDVGSEKYNEAVRSLNIFSNAHGSSLVSDDIQALADSYHNAAPGSGSLLNAMGMTSITNGEADDSKPADMAVIKGEDSEIVLNGAILTGSDTTINANGLSINLKGVTNGSKVTFAVTNDVDSVYDSIKDFLSEYNALIKEMNTLYSAPSARNYDPLTSEQKESMSDEEVELWEKKIKDSLLRNDSTLGGIMTSMKNAMMTSVEVDGKKYSLSSLGIMTSTDFKEGGLLHIFGDSDDSVYADKEDKLRSMLESDPDLVSKIMSGITSNLYEAMNKKMATSSLSSALTFYNDKQIKKQISNYESDISTWEDRLQKMEDRYYKQFSAMETAMAKLNQTQSSLAGFFGTN